jgi:hypothetical protein
MRFSIKQSFCGAAAGCAAIGSGQGFMICRGKICVYQSGLNLAFAIGFALAAKHPGLHQRAGLASHP